MYWGLGPGARDLSPQLRAGAQSHRLWVPLPHLPSDGTEQLHSANTLPSCSPDPLQCLVCLAAGAVARGLQPSSVCVSELQGAWLCQQL